jgi:DNA-binding FadR family transcriptional regulator
MTLHPIVRRTATQEAVEQLFRMIRNGTWKVGDRLPPEKELAEQLGVGRSTIREALQNLAAINVIESSAGHRTVIKSPTPGEIFRTDLVAFLLEDVTATELLEARMMIEPDCARLAAQRGSAADFAAVEKVIEDHRRALRAGQPVHELGAAFHLAVTRAARNCVAEMFMTSILNLLTERGRMADRIEGARERELADHIQLYEKIRSGDPEAARRAMLDHILDWSGTYDGVSLAIRRGRRGKWIDPTAVPSRSITSPLGAEREADTSGRPAARTPAVLGAIPGIVCRRRAVSSALEARPRSAARASMRALLSVTWPRRGWRAIRAAAGRAAAPA